MRFLALLALLLGVCAARAGEPTALERLQGKVVLTAAKSPYLVTHSLIMGAKDTLTIEPGVELRVDGYLKLMLRGVVRIQGTAKNPVRIVSAKEDANWMGLHLITDDRPVEIRGLVVEDAFRNTVSSATGIIAQSRFSDNYYGLWIESAPGLALEDCDFTGNRYGLTLEKGALAISKSRIDENVVGVWLEGDAKLDGAGNLFRKNQATDVSRPADADRQTASGRLPKSTLQAVEAKF